MANKAFVLVDPNYGLGSGNSGPQYGVEYTVISPSGTWTGAQHLYVPIGYDDGPYQIWANTVDAIRVQESDPDLIVVPASPSGLNYLVHETSY